MFLICFTWLQTVFDEVVGKPELVNLKDVVTFFERFRKFVDHVRQAVSLPILVGYH